MMQKGNLIVNSGGYRVYVTFPGQTVKSDALLSLNSYMVLGVTIKRKWWNESRPPQSKLKEALVDPNSSQADELRHLLNVVSGRAPDEQGRTSEPLVKEELAIVEFLTAKANSSKRARPLAAPNEQNPDDETPVDLLLGLAKTRSGKRAAEEEQRQLRLQQHRELEEQRLATRTNGTTSPWGYVAPQMPGLDVQQPFGNGGQRKVPRPLQPPPSRRSDAASEWSSNLMDNIMNPPTFVPQSQSPVRSIRTDSFASPMQQISPYQTMAHMPLPSPGQQMFSQQQLDGMHQFGTASLDGFDFGDLGLGVPQANEENGQFNPFALAQNFEEG
jgi:hypothetical protein